MRVFPAGLALSSQVSKALSCYRITADALEITAAITAAVPAITAAEQRW
jgi:hypothetical protein